MTQFEVTVLHCFKESVKKQIHIRKRCSYRELKTDIRSQHSKLHYWQVVLYLSLESLIKTVLSNTLM